MGLIQRNISEKVVDALSDTPVVILHGARQTGKSTLARMVAQSGHFTEYITLDDLAMLGSAKNDPVGFIAGLKGPVVLDEIQRAPELLVVIKAEVDRDRRPGRFLLTGSARILELPRLSESLVGRSEILTLWPFSQGEIRGVKEGFIDAVFSDEPPVLKASARPTETRDDLLNGVFSGGFPEVHARPRADRCRAWYSSYLTTILERDVRDLANVAALADMPRLLSLLAARAGGLLNYAEVARDTGYNKVTLGRYFALLRAIFLVQTVQPWFTNRIKRLMKSEKLYLCDTGLLAHLLDVDKEDRKRDPRAIGSLVENFVANELMKQQTWSRLQPRLYHFRDYAGTEVDFVLEAPRKFVGIEVKAGATVSGGDFQGLRKMADALGDRFHRGVVLHTGEKVVPFGANLFALPLSALWRLGATK